jgi:hypothetical protein
MTMDSDATTAIKELTRVMEIQLHESKAARQEAATQRSLDRNRATAQWKTDYRSSVLRTAFGVFFLALGFYYGTGWLSTNPNVQKTLYFIPLLVLAGGFALIMQDVISAVDTRKLVTQSWEAEAKTGTGINSFSFLKQTFWGDIRFVFWYLVMMGIAATILFHDHGFKFWS